MAILSIKNLEKHNGDTILFPAFHLNVAKSEIIAIYSSLNVRKILLDLFIGKASTHHGEILVNGQVFSKNKATYLNQLGILFFEDGLYDRLTVMSQFKFYQGLYESNQTIDQILKLTQLETQRHTKIRKLSHSEKTRVLFGKLLFQNPALFVLEEPDLNVDMETKRIYINIVQKLQQEGKAILVLTGNMENAITVADQIYRLDEDGLQTIVVETEDEQVVVEPESEVIHFNKIPTKVNEKIVLFDPPEIDYIESHDGQSNLYVKGEAFPSNFTLSHLEERLQHYGFFRCHRSYIVNLQKVREVITWTRNSYSLVLDDQEKSSIPLSKTKMAELKDMLGLK